MPKKQTNQSRKPAKCWSVFAKVGFILGIVSICIFWIPGFGMAIGIPGIVFSALGHSAIDDISIHNRKVGLITSIIAVILNLIATIAIPIIIATTLANNIN